MDLNEIKKFFEDNKDSEDVKAYLAGINPITAERVSAFLDTDDGKKLIQPRLDKHFTTGLETWKSKTFPSLLEEEIGKRFPKESPEKKELRELTDKLNRMERDKARSDMLALVQKKLGEKKLPVDFAEYLIGDTEELTNARIELFTGEYEKALKSGIESGVASALPGTAPKSGNGSGGKGITLDEFNKLNPKDRASFMANGGSIS